MTSICAATLARDDEARIGRCLLSTRDVVDVHLVIDTGSTDRTVDIAKNLGAVVKRRKWKDAGHNRTALLELAGEQGCDYLLAIDSDEQLVVEGEWWKAELARTPAPCYLLEVREPQNRRRYSMPKLLRAGEPWRYVGRAHEVLEPFYFDERQPLNGLAVVHHHDRADTTSKLPEVRDQLVASLVEDPTRSRDVFYLAQTYRDLGELETAVGLYKLRASLGGWDEEAWYAAFEAARLERDLDGLLAAWRRRPHRWEPLYELARLATELADLLPAHDDLLFVDDRPT